MVKLTIFLGRAASFVSQRLKLGAGITWAGEIALKIDPHILPKLIPPMTRVILIAGTNGKTTTAKMLKAILPESLTNETGANILNGLVGTLLTHPPAKYVILETDEATLPLVVSQITPNVVVLLDLFRDQLDRYGEVDTISQKWLSALAKVPRTLKIINADDPQLAWLGRQLKNVSFFGLANPKHYQRKMEHATDSIYCPQCGHRLTYKGNYFSHLGDWQCPNCHFKHPITNLSAKDITSPLRGVYNIYNTLAATLTGMKLGLSEEEISSALKNFVPSFGRQETIRQENRDITLLLSKNPAGFNESLRTVLADRSEKDLLILLNDRIPDGRDVSWIWDVDFEMLNNWHHLLLASGDRAFDLALRLKYAGLSPEVFPNFQKAIATGNDDLWILATYSAMLDVRKYITGRKIL